MKHPRVGFLLSMAGAVQLLMATAHAQVPAAPALPQPVAPAAPPAPVEKPSSPPSPADALMAPTQIPATPAVAGSTPPPPPPPAVPFPTVTVVANSRKAVLQQLQTGDWETVCSAPCRRPEDPKQAYRVAGRGLYPSDPFRLPRGTQQVEIKASMGSKGARIAGTIMAGAGLLGLALNGLVLLTTEDANPYDQKQVNKGPLVAGLVIGGLVALVGFTISASANTKVEVQDHLSPSPPPVE